MTNAVDGVLTASIEELQGRLASGELSSRQLTLLYLERIARFDQSGVKINSVLEINPDALFIAEGLDNERKITGARSLLHGIPILVKDNIETGDKMHTSAGSLALANHYAASDAFAVARLREAGAVLLGKTNMTEWANLMSSTMPAGYSSRGGQVLNPYGPGEFFVGGSSSGSAAAIAAGFAAAALGTETTGSILSPACQNSLVGIKPTIGLVPRTGVIPVSHTQDTIGAIGKTVKDATIVLNSIVGVDRRDAATLCTPQTTRVDYTTYLQHEDITGLRIGIPRDFYFDDLSEEEISIVDTAIHVLTSRGATIVDNITIPSARDGWDYGAPWYELKSALNSYLGKLPSHHPIHSLTDLVKFNDDHSEKTLKYGQDILYYANFHSGTLRETEYLESLRTNLEQSRTRGIDFVIKQHTLDSLMFPHDKGFDIAARAGYPSITVPAGYTSKGNPFGVQFTGDAYHEPLLIRIANVYEQATKHRVPPQAVIC